MTVLVLPASKIIALKTEKSSEASQNLYTQGYLSRGCGIALSCRIVRDFADIC